MSKWRRKEKAERSKCYAYKLQEDVKAESG